MQTVRAQDSNEYSAHSTDEQAGVKESVWHSQYSGSQTAFEQVNERFRVSVSGRETLSYS